MRKRDRDRILYHKIINYETRAMDFVNRMSKWYVNTNCLSYKDRRIYNSCGGSVVYSENKENWNKLKETKTKSNIHSVEWRSWRSKLGYYFQAYVAWEV